MNPRFLAVCNDSYAFREVRSLNDLVECLPSGESQSEIIDTIADPEPDLFHIHENVQLAAFVRDFVSTLSPRLRKIALLHYWDDRPQVEIARELGISRSAVSQSIERINSLGRKAISPLLQ